MMEQACIVIQEISLKLKKTKLLYHRIGLLTYQTAACPIRITPTFVSWFSNNYSLPVATGTATRPGCENYADYLKRHPK